ncbi:MAG: alpha/beta fold hydrolase [Candidatus Zixiibacteriota bacterium]
MKGEFCRVTTSDRIELQGLFVTPKHKVGETTVLHVHGLAGNFYENRFLDYLSEVLTKRGLNFLPFNNRGHDYIADFFFQEDAVKVTSKQIGSAYEVFEECILDIRAWIEFLQSRGSGKVILQGHSHGAVKAVYYLTEVQDPRITGLVLLSPSDDMGLQRSDLGKTFDEALDVARRKVKERKGEELMPSKYFVYPISARTYLDSFDKNSHLGIFNLSRTDREKFRELERVEVPVLATVGSVEEAFIGQPQHFLSDLKTQFRNAKVFTGCVIEGAPHNYLGYERVLSRKIEEWILNYLSGQKP